MVKTPGSESHRQRYISRVFFYLTNCKKNHNIIFNFEFEVWGRSTMPFSPNSFLSSFWKRKDGGAKWYKFKYQITHSKGRVQFSVHVDVLWRATCNEIKTSMIGAPTWQQQLTLYCPAPEPQLLLRKNNFRLHSSTLAIIALLAECTYKESTLSDLSRSKTNFVLRKTHFDPIQKSTRPLFFFFRIVVNSARALQNNLLVYTVSITQRLIVQVTFSLR